MNLRGVPIGARLGGAFALVLALLAFVVVGGNIMSDVAMRKLAAGQVAANAKAALAETMKSALLEAAVAMRNIGLQTEVGEMSKEEDRVKEQRKRYAAARDKLAALGLDAAEKGVLDSVAALDKEMEQPFIEAVGQSLNFNTEAAAKAITSRIDPLTQRSVAEINKLVQVEQAAGRALLDETALAEGQRHLAFYAIGALAFAIAAALAWVITRSITRPIGYAVEVARRVAQGDLTSDVHVEGKDEAAQLLRALHDMNNNLREIVAEVRGGTERISTASREISAGNTDLAARTEEQASSLEESASSMEELTSTVTQNAANAKQANQFAIGASEVAARGGKAMTDVMAMMGTISDASRRIGDIIGVIDGIAFQTNILALNAAVEAARAGDQGRGFAVVASEVRSLAQRSAEAAKEIKGLIENSTQRVDGGTRLVEGAGKTMGEIVSAVERVTGIMSDISAASQEQLAGIQQVGHAVTQMDRVTQQNASLVGQSAAAAENMAGQAEHLVRLVARFTLDARIERGEGGVSVPHAPVAPVVRDAMARRPVLAAAPALARGRGEVPVQPAPPTAAAADGWQEF